LGPPQKTLRTMLVSHVGYWPGLTNNESPKQVVKNESFLSYC